MSRSQSSRRRCQPTLDAMESRALLSTLALHAHPDHRHSSPHGPSATIIGTASAGGAQFTNFDTPGAGTIANAGTNANGISNSGFTTGFAIDNAGAFHNFLVNPLKAHSLESLNIGGSTTANAFGISRSGLVVGSDGNGHAFELARKRLMTFVPSGASAATAFGINDRGMIVGQETVGQTMPGFVQVNKKTYVTINAPSGPNTVNAQGISNKGQVVGFYVGTDGQDHGFMASLGKVGRKGATITGTPIADPKIPTVAGESGATFVFSQILGINDKGIAVGYYGDSTTSQHGFLYNTHTGQYTFLDDPSEAFHNGVEVTQITGINNAGEISGFYSDAQGVFHAFVATTSIA